MELAAVDALTSAQGQAVLRQVAETLGPGRPSGSAAVRLGTELRRRHPAGLVAAALTQHELRHRAASKFSRADEMLFTRDGLEQASAEPVARHRAARLASAAPDEALADLCAGIGGDLLALAAGARPAGGVLAVDTDPAHLRLALHNAEVYGVASAVAPCHADARAADLTGVGTVFADPARRAGGRRSPPGLSEPPLEWCVGLAGRVPFVAVKTAPGLPRGAVPDGWELELVARGRDLKEAVLWSPPLAAVPRRATVLPATDPGAPAVAHTLLPAPGPPVAVAPPGGYVLDPNPAVTRAGLVEELARSVGAWKLDERLAFLSADAEPRTPFARTLRVLDSLPWHERRIRERLAALDAGSVDIRRRGLPGDVERIRRGLRVTGSRRVTLLMTRAGGRPWCVIAEDVTADGVIAGEPPAPPAGGLPG